MDGVKLPQGYTEPLREGIFFFYQKFLVLIRSISKRWKAEMTLKPSSGFELVCQPSYYRYYQVWIKVTIQTDSIMTLNYEVFQNEFSVLSGRVIKHMFPLHICRPNDYMIEILFCLKFSFTIFLTRFFPLFSNVFSNILKIYELPNIYNKILKILLTIIIYQINSISQLHLAFELYWKCTLGGKRLFWH